MGVNNIDPGDMKDRIAELEEIVSDLEHNLIHDPLTRLKTRAFFIEEVGTFLEVMQQSEDAQTRTIQRKERFGFRNLSVIFFDIDHFKLVNDTYGHDIGDKVLVKVAQAIESCLRTGDTVARWGGEEIVASLLGANEEDAADKAEEIRASVEKLVFEEAPELKVTLSAGVAASERGVGVSELIKNADRALYQAKEGGRNKVLIYPKDGN